jgi:hypothetical protein
MKSRSVIGMWKLSILQTYGERPTGTNRRAGHPT